MTTVAVLADPPRPGLVLSKLVETSPLSATEAADLYAAGFRDVVRAVESSGGDLLVNYRPDDALPAEHRGDSVEEELRELAARSLDAPDAARFEPQVGETFAGRVGNTVTHLLEREGVASVAAVTPTAPFLARTDVDSAAMKLRRSEVVLGPASGGRVHFAGFTEPIDFTDVYDPPALDTLTGRARDAGLGVDFLPMHPVLETGRDLGDALALVDARRRADRTVPTHTTATFDDLELAVEPDADGGLQVVRDR